jgi:hypothetical protein
MGYDLRRLVRKGLIARERSSHRYRLTADGRRTCMFLTKTYVRIVIPTLGHLDPQLAPDIAARSPVARAWQGLDRALDDFIAASGIAA